MTYDYGPGFEYVSIIVWRRYRAGGSVVVGQGGDAMACQAVDGGGGNEPTIAERTHKHDLAGTASVKPAVW